MNEICWKKRKQMEFIAAATEQASQMKKLMELMELMKSICEWLRLDWSLLWVMPAERSSAAATQTPQFFNWIALFDCFALIWFMKEREEPAIDH